MTPLKASRSSNRSITAGQRIDFEAILTGSPPARSATASAFRASTSRSTNAAGRSRSDNRFR
jgi:hypothetical protein